jgi:adenylate cyclase
MVRIEAALIQRPDHAEALGMGAGTLVFLGENAKAEEWAKRAILLDPESYGIRYNVACIHAVVGKPGAALARRSRIHLFTRAAGAAVAIGYGKTRHPI